MDFPFDVSRWYWTGSLPPGYHAGSPPTTTISTPTVPTLKESSLATWTVGGMQPVAAPVYNATTNPNSVVDFWTNNPAYRLADDAMTSGSDGPRVADDVILTNVIGFDVKAWDPKAGSLKCRRNCPDNAGRPTLRLPVAGWFLPRHLRAYVDLGYCPAYTPAKAPAERRTHPTFPAWEPSWTGLRTPQTPRMVIFPAFTTPGPPITKLLDVFPAIHIPAGQRTGSTTRDTHKVSTKPNPGTGSSTMPMRRSRPRRIPFNCVASR